MAVVRLKLAERPTWTGVSRSMMPSLKAARAVTSLMVEHGTNPLFNASFWLTTLRTRPLVGSTATTARAGGGGWTPGAAWGGAAPPPVAAPPPPPRAFVAPHPLDGGAANGK